MEKRQRFITALGIIISAVFLFFAFRNLNPGQFAERIRSADPLWLAAGASTYFVAVAIISLRWQYLLRAVQFISLRALIPLVSIGYMGNNVYPLRSGEALRIYLLRRNHSVPVVKATTTVLVERVFDGIVMLTFVIVPLLFIESASQDIRHVATFAAPIFITALAIFLVMASKPNWLRRFVATIRRFLPGNLSELVGHASEDVIAGLEGLRSPAHLLGAVVTSYATWAVEAGVYWMVSFAFDLDASYGLMLLVVGTVNLAGLIPASPGQLGVFEFFTRSVLTGAGINSETALAYAIVVHMVIWLPVTLVGFGFLIRQGLGWKAVKRARELEEAPVNNNFPQKA